MAVATQTFCESDLEVQTEFQLVEIEFPGGFRTALEPGSRQEAHDWALQFRRAARHLEEIGRTRF